LRAPGLAVPGTDVSWKFVSITERHSEVVEPFRSFDDK
jgi:hypothetical protein